MAHRNEVVYQMAQDWIYWLDTRRFLGEPPQKNILALMMQDKGDCKPKGEPDGPVSAEIAAFNMAVSCLELGRFVPFIVVYCDYKPQPIKTMAHDLGIGRDQFYERAHSAASEVHAVAMRLVRLNSQMRKEVDEYVD